MKKNLSFFLSRYQSLIKVLKETSIYSIGGIFSKGLSVISGVFYTHLILPEDMGAYGYIMVITSVLSAFIILGGDNAYARYFFEAKSHKEKKVLTSTWFLFLFVWSILIVLIPLCFIDTVADWIFQSTKYNLLIIAGLVLMPIKLLTVLFNQALRNDFRIKAFVICNIATAIFSIIGSLLGLIVFELGVAAIYLGIIVAELIMICPRIYLNRKLLGLHFKIPLLKALLKFGVPFVPASLAVWVFSSADRIMIENFLDLDAVGIYTVALSMSSVLLVATDAFGEAWSPNAVKVYEEDPSKARALYQQMFKVILLLGGAVVLLGALIGYEVVYLLFSKQYSESFYPAMILLAGIAFKMTIQITAISIGLNKKTHFIMLTTMFVAVLNIGFNYIMIPSYGVIGAAVATMLSHLFVTVIYGLISQRLFPIHYPLKWMVIFLGVILLSLYLMTIPVLVRTFIFAVVLIIGIVIKLFYKREGYIL